MILNLFVYLQELRSSDRSVVLSNVSEATSGRYKCEVVTEAPAFKTAIKIKDMTVIGEGTHMQPITVSILSINFEI